MLNRIETRIMDYIFSRCRGKRTVLLPPKDILDGIAVDSRGNVITKFEITKKQLEVHMKNIVLDGYVDFSKTADKDGAESFVVTLTTRGEAFRRERSDIVRTRWRSIGWKIFLTLIGAGLSSIVWLIVRAL
ncbi:MAG: hypothetical protein FWC00_00260 [Firmicutes bacterium]|nr:hypothetical protein [Bacillota bacterium]